MLSDAELELLAALAPSSNLRRASRALGQPLATVSRRLIALEARLGHPLYLRKGRLLVPTRTGETVLERAARAKLAHDDVASALRELAEGGAARLAVAASPLFAELVLPVAIAELNARLPKLRVDVYLGHDVAELHHGRIDVALRRGPLADASSVRAKKLGRTTMVCVALPRPGLDLRAAPGARIDALPWVRVGARPEPLDLRWRAGRKWEGRAVSAHVTVDSQRVALELVRRGPFAARLNAFLVRDELASGTLVDVLPEAQTTEDVYAVFPDRREPDPHARALVSAVTEAATRARIWDPR